MHTTSYRNIGSIERFARITLGLVLLIVAVMVPGAWWGYFGILPLITGLIGWCPLYSLLRISTAKKVAR